MNDERQLSGQHVAAGSDDPAPTVASSTNQPRGDNASAVEGGLVSRRTVVREGVKLAFVAPVISTFLASQAYAANYSCYPAGHVCTNLGTDPEPCCNGACPGNPDFCP